MAEQSFELMYQFSSVAQSCPTPCNPHGLQHSRLPCPSPFPWACSNLCPLSHWCHPTHPLILCRPLLLPPLIFPSIRVFSNESVLLIRCPKYQSISFSISHSSEYSGLISFRIDWFDLLAVQWTLKSLLQDHSSKASIRLPSLQSKSHIHTWLKGPMLAKWCLYFLICCLGLP